MANFQRLDGYVSGMSTNSGGSGRNRIEAANDAEIKRRTRGYDTAIIDARFYTGDTNGNNMWKLTAPNVNNILIGAGIATCYGYDLVNKSEALLSVTAPASGTKYAFIYLSWDLSPLDDEIVGIGIYDNGANPSWTPTFKDNLALIPNGKYQMPLYRLTISTTGNITATQSWTTLGIETKRGIEWAKNSMLAINQPQTDSSTNIANTAYVRQAISDVKNIDTGTVSLRAGYSASINEIKRQVNFVILNLTLTVTEYNPPTITFLIGNIEQKYRPKNTIIGGFHTYVSAGIRPLEFRIEPNGEVYATYSYRNITYDINLGYEIN